MIAEFLLLSVPFTVAMTLPMAVLVSTLHAFSRMASENEITAFKASGIAMQRLMVPVIIAASDPDRVDGVVQRPGASGGKPPADDAHERHRAQEADVRAEGADHQSDLAGRLFLRTARLFGTNQMRDVAIYNMSDPQTRLTIRADSGLLELSENRETCCSRCITDRGRC